MPESFLAFMFEDDEEAGPTMAELDAIEEELGYASISRRHLRIVRRGGGDDDE